jgi:hypothetical protein
MSKLQQDLSVLREKIAQQRNTVEALKRDGHEYADAERQLKQMLRELGLSDNTEHQGQC